VKKQSLINKFDVHAEKNKYYSNKNFDNNLNNYNQNYSNHKSKGNIAIPLNKDYDINLDNNQTPKIPEHPLIEVKYNFLSFAKIFFNLKLLYKTDKPEKFQNQFIPEVMRSEPRKELDLYKKVQVRDRAKTFVHQGRSCN
jgi:hypothetical protein